MSINSLRKNKFYKKKFIFSNKVKILENNNLFIITVPTPINKNKTPNLNMLKKSKYFSWKIYD